MINQYNVQSVKNRRKIASVVYAKVYRRLAWRNARNACRENDWKKKCSIFLADDVHLVRTICFSMETPLVCAAALPLLYPLSTHWKRFLHTCIPQCDASRENASQVCWDRRGVGRPDVLHAENPRRFRRFRRFHKVLTKERPIRAGTIHEDRINWSSPVSRVEFTDRVACRTKYTIVDFKCLLLSDASSLLISSWKMKIIIIRDW